MLVAPPFPYLLPVKQAVAGSNAHRGQRQNAYFEQPGAFTGKPRSR